MITINKDYSVKEKPNIQLSVQRVESNVWYSLGFYKYHYLTSSLNKSCKCLLFYWNDVPVAFVALLNTPRKGMPYGFSISRIVILPDFQGLGLSSRILEFCGGIITAQGNDHFLYMKTIHDKVGAYMEKSDMWTPTSYNGKSRKNVTFEEGKYNNRLERKSYCYKYSGKALDGYSELLLPVNELRNKKNLG